MEDRSGQSRTLGESAHGLELEVREYYVDSLVNEGPFCSGDPLSNISGNLDFASKDDAIRFCEKHRWEYEVLEPQVTFLLLATFSSGKMHTPQERKVVPKSYGANFAWNKRTRLSNK